MAKITETFKANGEAVLHGAGLFTGASIGYECESNQIRKLLAFGD
jgi:hypothetical protein